MIQNHRGSNMEYLSAKFWNSEHTVHIIFFFITFPWILELSLSFHLIAIMFLLLSATPPVLSVELDATTETSKDPMNYHYKLCRNE